MDPVLRGDARTDERNLLSLLLRTRSESGALTIDDVRDEIITFMFAGSESVASTLTWMWHLLTRNPDARKALVAEVQGTVGDRLPTAADIDRLTWTTAVVQETMRLYPPVWLMSRTALADDTFGGNTIPAGSFVMISPYLNHRDPRWWDDPESFDPVRFLAVRDRPRLAYLPFGAGRRVCIGASLGIMQAVLLSAMIVQRFNVEDPRPARAPKIDPCVSLRPRGGVPMTLVPTR